MSGNWTPGDRPESECVEWPGALSADGYGWRTVGNRQILAHRKAYADAYGPIEPGKVIMHMCDNTKCINPQHLRAGTRHENMMDMAAKGRHARGKLTPLCVNHIRDRAAEGTATYQEIADEFGVAVTLVSHIARGRAWRHVANRDGSKFEALPPRLAQERAMRRARN